MLVESKRSRRDVHPAGARGETRIAHERRSFDLARVDVLKLLARGKSNKEIGAALFVSETTVKSHVRNIFAKLNVMSRTEALAAASQRGLIRL